MSINFTPLKYNNNSSFNNYNSSPNKEHQFPSNNFNHFSTLSKLSVIKEKNNSNNLDSLNLNSPIKNLNFDEKDLNNNELNNSFKNISINNINESKESFLIQELKKQYDQRIISLYNNIKMVISKIENDDILASMRDDMDSNNSPFITNRIKEIIDDNFYSEKEKIIE